MDTKGTVPFDFPFDLMGYKRESKGTVPFDFLGAYAIERSLTDSELSRLHAAIDSDAA
jgi:hypothetical protein